MDELTQDIGIELHTDSIMHRAEQLARLESDKIVDKVGYWNFNDFILVYNRTVKLNSLCRFSHGKIGLINSK